MQGERIESENLLKSAKSCGYGSKIWGSAIITGIEQVEIGDNVHIGDGAFIRAEGGLIIGDNTHISQPPALHNQP